MTKFSNKYITTFYGALLGPFCPNFGKNEFSWKKKLCQLLNIPTIYNRAKNQKKLMSHSWEKFRPHGRTDRWTDRQRWINTTLGRTKKESYSISKVLGINWSCNSQLVNWNWMVTSFFLFTDTKCTPTMWPNRWYQQAWLSVKEQTVKDLFASDHETPLPQDNIETSKWDRKPYWWNLSFAEICAKLDYRNRCDELKKQFYLLKKSISEITSSTGETDNSITKTTDLLRKHIEFLLQETRLKTS